MTEDEALAGIMEIIRAEMPEAETRMEKEKVVPRGNIEQENEKYVLQALAEAKDGAGAREVMNRVSRFLKEDGKRRKLTEEQAREVLESLTARGKVSKRRTSPATWQLTFEGKGHL